MKYLNQVAAMAVRDALAESISKLEIKLKYDFESLPKHTHEYFSGLALEYKLALSQVIKMHAESCKRIFEAWEEEHKL